MSDLKTISLESTEPQDPRLEAIINMIKEQNINVSDLINKINEQSGDEPKIIYTEGRKPYVDKPLYALGETQSDTPDGYASIQKFINSNPDGTMNIAHYNVYKKTLIENKFTRIDPLEIKDIKLGARIAYVRKDNKWRSGGWLVSYGESNTKYGEKPKVLKEGEEVDPNLPVYRFIMFKSFSRAIYSCQLDDVVEFWYKYRADKKKKPKKERVIVEKLPKVKKEKVIKEKVIKEPKVKIIKEKVVKEKIIKEKPEKPIKENKIEYNRDEEGTLNITKIGETFKASDDIAYLSPVVYSYPTKVTNYPVFYLNSYNQPVIISYRRDKEKVVEFVNRPKYLNLPFTDWIFEDGTQGTPYTKNDYVIYPTSKVYIERNPLKPRNKDNKDTNTDAGTSAGLEE